MAEEILWFTKQTLQNLYLTFLIFLSNITPMEIKQLAGHINDKIINTSLCSSGSAL